MIRLHAVTLRTYTPFPNPTLFRSRLFTPPFSHQACARVCRLRRRRAKNESAALARRAARPVPVRGGVGGRPKAARPVVYAANGGSSDSGPLLSSVRGTMLAERSKATRKIGRAHV